MRIMVYGSTYITEKVLEVVGIFHELVGQVPSENPAFEGKFMAEVYEADEEHPPYDLLLSIQYDRKITRLTNAYNLHTGLLPEWGGCDILYHTLRLGERRQGLTLHRMTPAFDEGGVVSRIDYPVFPDDQIVDLYARVAAIAPHFTLAALDLLPLLDVARLSAVPPRIFRRASPTALADSAYHLAPKRIRDYIEENP